ncbi:MAG TPA: hypothetical protein VFV38_14560, partial [Ktedonobacteraceae bacterium]|nr:hypothetical protein [Ktedonobacteraceae bacterium]
MDDSLPSGGGAAPVDPSCAVSSPAVPTGTPTRRHAPWPAGLRRPLAFVPRLFSVRRVLLVSALLLLVLFADLIASWPVVPSSTASALAFPNPNAPIPAPAWLHPASQPGKKPNLNQSSSAIIPVAPRADGAPHTPAVAMKPARLTLTPAAQHFLSSDGQLGVDIPAGSLTASQVSQFGGVSLSITQVQPGSGGLESEHLFFGTYEFQFFTAQGQPIRQLALHHPLTLSYHLNAHQQLLLYKGQQVYALWNAVQPDPAPPSLTAQAAVTPKAVSASQSPILRYTQVDQSGTVFRVNSGFAASSITSATTPAARVQLAAAVSPASTVTFGTEAPEATWGKPQDFQVGLSSGSLSYTYSLALPAGPGGLTPPLSLNYSSAALNENHNLQSTNPWVGQGWSLDLGSVSWGQENVTP